MKRFLFLFLLSLGVCYNLIVFGQSAGHSSDSVSVRILPKYDSVGNFHRKVFGENYRKHYALETKVPVIVLSKIAGGLHVVSRGGGNQTRSLRLEDDKGKEWVLRSIEKYPEVLLPNGLQETFLRDVIKDNMSAQHPFAALVVPVLSEAIGAPHSNPIIGLVAADPGLGVYLPEFQNTLCLLEEREPAGKSDNTEKMRRKLVLDYNNSVDDILYLKLKCLDVLLGDWDRHDDQWRWKGIATGQGIVYLPVPRDRDQVFYRSEGLAQRFAQSSWFLPMMQGYERNIKDVNWFLWEGREINSKIFAGIDEETWNSAVVEFCMAMSDQVLENALKKLPEPGYTLDHDRFLKQLSDRRTKLPGLMNRYYRFFNKVVDLELSDRDEKVMITGTKEGGLQVVIKGTGVGGGNQTFKRQFDPSVTREVRLYFHNGNDSLSVDNRKSKISLKLIGGGGLKYFDVENSRKSIRLYTRPDSSEYSGRKDKLIKHLSNDSSNMAYVAKDLYKRRLVYPNIGFNNDDGLLLGLSLRFTAPGFRKAPYGSSQAFSFLYSFGTSALKINYAGEWLRVLGKADLILNASAFAPTNTQNYFGLGNGTSYDRSANNISYYRARFSLYQTAVSLRWRGKRSVFSAGPVFQYYSYDQSENSGRLISLADRSFLSQNLNVTADRTYAGAILKYSFNSRDHDLLPASGIFLDARLTGYQGLNRSSDAFGQLNASISFHQKIGPGTGVIIADRIGGGLSAGRPPFYQAQFLGGQGTLMGYRQFRFAGDHSLYNNLEMRLRLGNFVSYVLPGQVGLIGLYDAGRVWQKGERSNVWHHGVGTGIYFAPASLAVARVIASYSREGWYPYFALSLRY